MKSLRIYIDCDGVLTDGTLTIDHNGEKLFKRFHTRDVRAIRELVARGFEVILISADDWGGLTHFAEKVGAELLVTRDKGELPQPYIAIGDDAWDVTMLTRAAAAFCPLDADRSVLDIPGIGVVNANGGTGVIAEMLRMALDG